DAVVVARSERAALDLLCDPSLPPELKRRAAYCLAQVHERRGEWEKMAELLDSSGIAPGRDDTNLYDFNADTRWSQGFLTAQRLAINRGIPAIYVVALQNSGSSFLTAFITTAFGI